jgi:hypothetical protein
MTRAGIEALADLPNPRRRIQCISHAFDSLSQQPFITWSLTTVP